MKGTHDVLAKRCLQVLRSVALTGGTIQYWQINNAVCTKEHAVPVRAIGVVMDRVNKMCLAQELPRLTTLVVDLQTGKPSPKGMAAIGVTDVPTEQEKCWQWGRDQRKLMNSHSVVWKKNLPPE